MISVIMSTYNEKIAELDEAINSVLNQTYSELELIIVNDNPNNLSLGEYLKQKSCKDSRIRIISNKHNMGLAMSLNTALKTANGEYIARMDADDISLPTRLEKQLSYIEGNPQVNVVATKRINIDENGAVLPTINIVINDDDVFRKAILYSNIITHPSVMLRKSDLIRLGGYRDFKAAQDYDLWLRGIKNGFVFRTIPEVLLKYRIRQNSISNLNVAKQHGCMLYARYLYDRDLQNDDFNHKDYEIFLKKKHMFTDEDKIRYNDAYGMLFYENQKISSINRCLLILKATVKHKEVFNYYMRSRKKDILVRDYIQVEKLF